MYTRLFSIGDTFSDFKKSPQKFAETYYLFQDFLVTYQEKFNLSYSRFRYFLVEGFCLLQLFAFPDSLLVYRVLFGQLLQGH